MVPRAVGVSFSGLQEACDRRWYLRRLDLEVRYEPVEERSVKRPVKVVQSHRG